ncbi:hypothetical protein FACS189487_00890 [Campylobacterota bacterium]|nr:hypothetical protein FACS189487_00890 [Campylobacterota bacterium]
MRLALLLICALVFAGCAAHSSAFAPVENALRGGSYDQALAALEAKAPSEGDRLPYELNRAIVLQAAGRYEESISAFEAAKALVEEFDALSVTEQTASLVVNDAAIAYYGEDYERVYLNFYAAIDYLMMGDLHGARVEAMQADARLKLLNGAYDDAAARLLGGVIFDALGERGDALVSYRQAYRAYKDGFFGVAVPAPLKSDLLRLSKQLGIGDEYKQYLAEFGKEYERAAAGAAGSAGRDTGELVAIVSAGFAPIKRSERAMFPSPYGGIVVAIPHYETRVVSDPIYMVDGEPVALSLISNITAIAADALAKRLPEITARSVARVTAKKALEYAAEQAGNAAEGGKDGSMTGLAARLLMQVTNIATEVADTRSWLTLPDKIYFARATLPAGKHKVVVGGTVREVEIKRGGRAFVALRVF